MSIITLRGFHGRSEPLAGIQHAAWFVGGCVLGFAVPFVFSSSLELNHDLYYGIYFAVVLTFLGAYVLWTGVDVRHLFLRNWKWSVALGAVAAVMVVAAVYSREDSTPRPDGLYFAFSILWRGVLYGTVDALLLSAFPVAVAFALFGGELGGTVRKLSYGVVAFGLVLIITAAYHLGYDQFRDDGVTAPETGNSIISAPAILTVNPVGSVIAHASMHVAADVHAYETDVYLPPQTDAD